MEEIVMPLRCPFCGGKAEVHDLGNMGYFVKCPKCEVNQDKLYKQRCDAVKAWNKRINSPVVHGKWMRVQDDLCECSACHKYWIEFGDAYDYHYCPHCGARMDGET